VRRAVPFRAVWFAGRVDLRAVLIALHSASHGGRLSAREA
jgi:hypothetical protein